jgi:hypothetical protein
VADAGPLSHSAELAGVSILKATAPTTGSWRTRPAETDPVGLAVVYEVLRAPWHRDLRSSPDVAHSDPVIQSN